MIYSKYSKHGNNSVNFLWYPALPLLITGLLGIGLEGDTIAVLTAICSNASPVCFKIFVIAVMCSAAQRYRFSILRGLGLTQAAIYLAQSLAVLASGVVSVSLVEYIADLLIIVASVLTVIFMAGWKEDVTSKMATVDNALQTFDQNSFLWFCSGITRKYELTQREEEVLFYLLKGWTNPAIAEELYVADSTIKSHVKHIYSKLSVHGRKELMQLIEAEQNISFVDDSLDIKKRRD